jgi:hypothetical protein
MERFEERMLGLVPKMAAMTDVAESMRSMHREFLSKMSELVVQQTDMSSGLSGTADHMSNAVMRFETVAPMVDRLGSAVDMMQLQVRELAMQLDQSGRTMEQVGVGITMAAQQQLQASGSIDTQATQLSSAMGRFEHGLTDLMPKMSAMADVAEAMRSMHREFLAKMSELVVQQTDTSTGLSGTADQMSSAVTRLEVVARMVERLGASVDLMQAQITVLATQIDQSGRTMEQVGSGITMAAQQQQQTSGRMDAQAAQLSTAMGSFERELAGLMPKMSAMADVADAMRGMHREFLAKMSELVVQQTDMSTELRGTTIHMSDAIVVFENIDNAVKLLHSQIQNLVGKTAQSSLEASQLMRQLDEMARSTRGAADVVRESVSSQKDIMVQISGGQQRTGNAVDRLDQAVKQIEAVFRQIEATQTEFREQFREYMKQENAALNNVVEGYLEEKAKGSFAKRIGDVLGRTRNGSAN